MSSQETRWATSQSDVGGTGMNHKHARIIKLLRAGRTVEQIIKTLGYIDTPEIRERIERVRKEIR
jgi:hypothetical protein